MPSSGGPQGYSSPVSAASRRLPLTRRFSRNAPRTRARGELYVATGTDWSRYRAGGEGPHGQNRHVNDERRILLNERLRAEFIAGAEAEWRKRTGRPMTREELVRVLRRYLGDLPEIPEVL